MRSRISLAVAALLASSIAFAQTPPFTAPQWQMTSDVPNWLQVRDRYGHWVTFATVGNNVMAFSGGLSFACSTMPALTGDVSNPAGSCTTTLAPLASAGTYGAVNQIPYFTVDTKGRINNAGQNPIATDACLIAGAALSGNELVNAQSGATYTFQATDKCHLVTFNSAIAVAATLLTPGAGTGQAPAGWWADIKNLGSGMLTIGTPGGVTINGQSSLQFARNAGVRVISDGVNYQVAGTIPAAAPASISTSTTGGAMAPATAGSMTGSGSSCTLTPTKSGNVFATFATNGTVSAGVTLGAQIRWGTGTAPALGAAITGAAGGPKWAAASSVTQTSAQGVTTGLAIGTPIWLDLAVFGNGSSTYTMTNITCTAFEY